MVSNDDLKKFKKLSKQFHKKVKKTPLQCKDEANILLDLIYFDI